MTNSNPRFRYYTLIAQKNKGDDFEIVFGDHSRRVVKDKEWNSRGEYEMMFVHKMFMDTITYREAWIKDFNKKRNANAKHTLQYFNGGGGELDAKTFVKEEDMEDYIDKSILPFWEDGDYIVTDGSRREVFDNYEA